MSVSIVRVDRLTEPKEVRDGSAKLLAFFDCAVGGATFQCLRLVRSEFTGEYHAWAPTVYVGKHTLRPAVMFDEALRAEIAEAASKAYKAMVDG